MNLDPEGLYLLPTDELPSKGYKLSAPFDPLAVVFPP